MGGHESKQSVADTAVVLGSAVQSVTQNCINYVYAGNTINISGTGNVVNAVNQAMAVAVNSSCAASVTQSATFSNSLQAKVAQTLKDQEVALTQWMDSSSDDSEAHINQIVSTNVSSTTVQSCLNSINSQNILNITGSGNIVTDIVQSGTATLLSQCLLGQGQTSTAVNNIANTVNQHSTYDSENPLAFITDAIEALMRSAMILVAIVFVAIICFVALFLVLRGSRRSPAAQLPGAPLATAPRPASAT